MRQGRACVDFREDYQMSRGVMVSVVAVALTVDALGQRVLPPVDDWPRSKEAWQTRAARPEYSSGPFREAFPEYASSWDFAWERMSAMRERYLRDDVVFDAALADDLIGELYTDYGHPILNSSVPDFVLRAILGQIVLWPEERLPAEARERLASGLIEYWRAGGGRWLPMEQAMLASVIDAVALGDPELQRVADDVLFDSMVWAETVENDGQRKRVTEHANKYWGDRAALRILDAQAEARGELPKEGRSARYEEALAALDALLAEDPGERWAFFKRLRIATDAALYDFKEPKEAAFERDLTLRLLTVYERLLARRPEIPERPCAYIQEQLVRLALKSDRLATERHWEVWTKTAQQVGPTRVTSHFRKGVLALLDKKEPPAVLRKQADALRSLVGEAAGVGQNADERPAPRVGPDDRHGGG